MWNKILVALNSIRGEIKDKNLELKNKKDTNNKKFKEKYIRYT